MQLPIAGLAALPLGLIFGFCFGFLLQRGHVANANVIINQFRLSDHTVIKVMLTAIIVGGVGVFFLHQGGFAAYHVKPANLLGVGLGAAFFGIGMAVSGYCPGTGLAALGTGSIHALATLLGMVLGAILYALSFDWMMAKVLSVWALGPVRLPDATGVPDLVWFAGLIVAAIGFFAWVESRAPKA